MWPFFSLLGFVVFGPATAAERSKPPPASLELTSLCNGAQHAMEEDPQLRSAMVVAFPDIAEDTNKSENCVFPYKALVYNDQIIVLTKEQSGPSCPHCPAQLTVSILRRDGPDLRFVRRQRRFLELGSWGELTAVHPLKLGRDDAAIFEGGDAGQGYNYDEMHVFAFRAGRAQRLTPADGLPMGYSDCAAEPLGCSSVEGTWRADPRGRIVIHYKGHDAKGRKIDQKSIFELRGGQLSLTSGRIPGTITKAFREARGE